MVKVEKKGEDKPAEGAEDTLADAIRRVSAGLERLGRSGLNERAIRILISHETGLPQKAVRAVLEELRGLAEKFADGD
jgi:hypothetical protein